jgi:hypothetical protein
MQVVHEEFGIVEGLMTTVHATTGWFHVLYLLSFALSYVSFKTLFCSHPEDCWWSFDEGLERWTWCWAKHNSEFHWCSKGSSSEMHAIFLLKYMPLADWFRFNVRLLGKSSLSWMESSLAWPSEFQHQMSLLWTWHAGLRRVPPMMTLEQPSSMLKHLISPCILCVTSVCFF